MKPCVKCLEREIAHQREIADLKFAAIKREGELREEAVKADKAFNEYRFEAGNKLREQIERTEHQYLTKENFEKYHQPIIDRMSALENKQWMIAGGVGVVAILAEVLIRFMGH
jgi:hypothetical protein